MPGRENYGAAHERGAKGMNGLRAGWVLACAAWAGGCATVAPPGGAGGQAAAPGAAAPAMARRAMSDPFAFEALPVPHGCFVDAVRFFDAYHRGPLAGAPGHGGWAKILQWGAREDFSIGPGHAMTVFVWQDRLHAFDGTGGFVALDLPAEAGAALERVGPPLFARYPQFDPVLPHYLDDRWLSPGTGVLRTGRPGNDAAWRHAERVAEALGQHRRVHLVRFTYRQGGEERASAAAVFLFQHRLCLYLPELGTMVTRVPVPSVDNLPLIESRLRRALGAESAPRIDRSGG
jgi:hypothetical protein